MSDERDFDIREFLGNEVAIGHRNLAVWSPEEPGRLTSKPTDLVCLSAAEHPKLLVPLEVFLNAIAAVFDLEPGQIDTVACLAPEWDGSWSQLIIAAQTL